MIDIQYIKIKIMLKFNNIDVVLKICIVGGEKEFEDKMQNLVQVKVNKIKGLSFLKFFSKV